MIGLNMKKSKLYSLNLLIIGLIVILMVRDCVGIEINRYIFVIYYVVAITVLDMSSIIALFCFTFPLMTGLPGNYIYLVFLFGLLIKKKQISRINVGLMLCLVFLEFFGIIWIPQAETLECVGTVAAVSIFLILIFTEMNKEGYRRCINCFITGTTVVAGIMLIATFQQNSLFYIIQQVSLGQGRLGYMIFEDGGMHVMLDPNAMASFSLVAATCCLGTFKRKSPIQSLLIFALQMSVGFITMSRSWLIFSIIVLAIYILTLKKNIQNLKRLISILLVGVVIIFVIQLKFPYVVEGILERFTDDTMNKGNGRIFWFLRYLEIFLSDIRFILVGSGVSHYLEAYGSIGQSAHNGLLQIFLCYGIVGGVCILFGMIYPLRKIKHKTEICAFLPLIAYVLFVQTIQFLNPYIHMYPYLIGIYYLYEQNEMKYSGECK